MADKAKDTPISIKTDDSKSPADIQKEMEESIEATLNTTIGPTVRRKRTKKTDVKAEPSKVESAPKNTLEKQNTGQLKTTVDNSQSIKVKVNKPNTATARPVIQEKEFLRKAIDTEPTTRGAEKLELPRKNLTIQKPKEEIIERPASKELPAQEGPDAKQNKEEAKEPKEVKKELSIAQVAKSAKEKEAAESEEVTKKGHTLIEAKFDSEMFADTTEAKAVDQGKSDQKDTSKKSETAQEKDQDQVKVFDTKKYHLPMKASKRHHKNSASKDVVVVILIAVMLVIGFVILIDMEVIDIGYELPFDLF